MVLSGKLGEIRYRPWSLIGGLHNTKKLKGHENGTDIT